MADALTAACDPKAWMLQSRTDLLDASGFTPSDLTRAVRRNRKLLNAKRVRIVDDQERAYDDNDAQLRAVDMFYDLAGVKAPRAQTSSASAGVEVVIDAQSGQVIVRAVTK